MDFYTSPAFFVVMSALAVPAVVLGLSGRRIAPYGFVASCIMLVLLFSASGRGLAAFLLFTALATASAFAVLREWTSGKKRAGVWWCALIATIAPLVIYKCTAAWEGGVLGFIGISYLTFKAVQVLIEIKDGLIKDMRPVDYLYFLTFFATFTSGPIDRSRRFWADAQEPFPRNEYADLLARGILLLLVGAVMQLVVATIVHSALDPTNGSAAAGLFSINAIPGPAFVRTIARAYGYALYLFFDFAGYSYMAMGVSYCFGVRTPRNFNAPFVATDLKDFWNRWHITLSTWLRDFVFMRFVRVATKRKLFSSRVQTACAGYVVNMALMGAWHGLTVDYLAYGLYHGLLLAATEVYQKRCAFHKRNRKKTWYKVLSWFITLQLVVIGFALFSGQAHHIVERLING